MCHRKLCVKLVTYQNYTKMHGPKNILKKKLRMFVPAYHLTTVIPLSDELFPQFETEHIYNIHTILWIKPNRYQKIPTSITALFRFATKYT